MERLSVRDVLWPWGQKSWPDGHIQRSVWRVGAFVGSSGFRVVCCPNVGRRGCRRGILLGITQVSKCSMTASPPVGALVAPGETESGSAGTQPDKGYPGRRCAKWCILPLVVQRRQRLFFFPHLLDTGVMPPKILRRQPHRAPPRQLPTTNPEGPFFCGPTKCSSATPLAPSHLSLSCPKAAAAPRSLPAVRARSRRCLSRRTVPCRPSSPRSLASRKKRPK